MITLALSKGRIFDETLPLLDAAGIRIAEDPEKSRKLIVGTSRSDLRVVLVRASDVPTYVQYGAADLGGSATPEEIEEEVEKRIDKLVDERRKEYIDGALRDNLHEALAPFLLFDLAPVWAAGKKTLPVVEQQRMTACLAAHVNKYGVHVPVSIQGPAASSPIPVGPTELADFSVREACFFGNLFSEIGRAHV